MSKIAILKSDKGITGVYVSPDLLDYVEYIDYSQKLTSKDEVVEEAIENGYLIPLDNSFTPAQ